MVFAEVRCSATRHIFDRQIRIECLRDGGSERVEDARVLLLPGRAFELTVQALGTATRQLRDRMDPERLQIAFDGRANGPQVPKSARLPFARALASRGFLRLLPDLSEADTVPSWLLHIQLRGSVERVVARLDDRGAGDRPLDSDRGRRP